MTADSRPDTRADARRAPRTLTAQAAAAMLGVHERTVRRAIERGELAAEKAGGVFRISQADLARYRRRFPPLTGLARETGGPPPRPRRMGRAAIPVPATPLIGREREIAAGLAALAWASGDAGAEPGPGTEAVARLLTLTGPGGVGKTRLALALAAAWEATGRGRAVFVDLAAVAAPDLVPAAIARALGVRATRGPVLDRIIEVVRDGQNETSLLILDNFEHLLTAAASVAALVAGCPDLVVVVTSRRGLRLAAERTVPVAPLDLPSGDGADSAAQIAGVAAIRLFVARARAVVPEFALTDADAQAVAAICRRLDGLPLAIELAAARIRHLPPQALLDRLERRGRQARLRDAPGSSLAAGGDTASLGLLTGGCHDQPARLRSLRDAIAWSYDLLSEEEQALFRHVSVFAGGFTLGAAEAVVGGQRSGVGGQGAHDSSLTPVLDVLSALVDHSLVRMVRTEEGGGRFALLETLREFAAEQLAAEGEEEAVRASHAAWAVALAEGAAVHYRTAAEGAAVAGLEAEDDNLRAALAWVTAPGAAQPAAALRLGDALARSWFVQGRLREGLSWLEAILACDVGAADTANARAGVLAWVGALAPHLGNYTLARARLDEALTLYRGLGRRQDEAMILLRLGVVAEYGGDDALGTEWYEAALELFRELGDPIRTGLTLENLADAAYRRGDFPAAAALADEALATSRRGGDELIVAQALAGVAQVASVAGSPLRAAACLRESLDLAMKLGTLVGVADALSGSAGLAAARGQSPVAARLLGATAAVRERSGSLRVNHLAHHEWTQATVRAALGEAALEAEMQNGRALEPAAALAEAIAVLDAVSGGEAVEVVVAGGWPGHRPLTRREVEVLRLLAEGRSDREIAAMLSIARHTASNHVSSILAKLGLESRAAAAVYAVRSGLR